MSISIIDTIKPLGSFPVIDASDVQAGNERLTSVINNKVDKVEGKGLSENDYSTSEKNKLSGIEFNANNYVHPTTSGFKHIPAGGASGKVLGWVADGTAQWVDQQGGGTEYSDATEETHGLMSTADKTKLDGIATGATNVTVDSSLNASSANAIQNKVVKNALDTKANTSDLAAKADASAVTTLAGRVSDVETEQTALDARMDTFTNLAEGSTTGDAELADIRVKADGTTANSAGSAVRDQITMVNNDFNWNESQYGIIDYVKKFGFVSGDVNTSTGAIDPSTTMKVINGYIPVEVEDTLRFYSGSSNYTMHRATYDENFNKVDAVNITVTTNERDYTVVNSRIKYVRFSVSNVVASNNYHVTNITNHKISNIDLLTDETRSVISRLISELGGEEYDFSIGYQLGKLNSNGNVDISQSDFYTIADYIEMSEGDELLIINPHLSGAYTMNRATYDSSKTLVAYDTINVSSQTYKYEYNPAVKYVKFSVSKTVRKQIVCLKPTKAANIECLIKKTDYELSEINKSVNCVDYGKKFGFVHGKLSTSDGTVNTDTGFFTIGDYVPVTSGDRLVIEAVGAGSYSIYRAFYDKNKNYIEGTQVLADSSGVRILDVLPTVAYVKYCISRAVYTGYDIRLFKSNDLKSGDLHLMSLSANSEVVTYTGAIDLSNRSAALISKLFTFNDTNEPSGKTHQGFAISNNILFQFFDNNLCRLLDVKNKGAHIADVSVTCGHGNSASFTNDYYDSEDEFPTCYVSDINGNVYLLRISRSESTLLKTLYFDPLPSAYGYTPQLAIDTENNIGYVVGKKTDEIVFRTAIISRVDLSQLTNNNNGTYTPALIDRFEINMVGDNPILQGIKYLNGCVFIPSGASGDVYYAFINVIDVTNKEVTASINSFPSAIEKKELEGVEFIPNMYAPKFDLICHFRRHGYYRLTF